MQSVLGSTRKMDIVFYRSGRMDITARVARILSLARGDVIDMLVSDREVYMYVRYRAPLIGRHEATVYPTNKKGKHFRAYSKRLCRFMLCKCGGEQSVSLYVGKPVCDNCRGTLLPIILRHSL